MMIFVILHYMSLDATISLVDHIRNDLLGEKKVIIVDNASPNGSGRKLEKKFHNDTVVKVILSSHNVGFARGCNIGFKYASQYSPEYITILNNDIEFCNSNFLIEVDKLYHKNYFDVMGPDIIVPETGIHQNPKRQDVYPIEEVKKLNEHNKKLLNQNQFLFTIRAYVKNVKILRKLKLMNDVRHKKVDYSKAQENIILHGSILVFSKKFIKKCDAPFSDKTFFYFETEIMGKLMAQRGLISRFEPTIKVLHHQNTSTRESFKSFIGRQRFQIKNMINSTDVYLELFEIEQNDK